MNDIVISIFLSFMYFFFQIEKSRLKTNKY